MNIWLLTAIALSFGGLIWSVLLWGRERTLLVLPLAGVFVMLLGRQSVQIVSTSAQTDAIWFEALFAALMVAAVSSIDRLLQACAARHSGESICGVPFREILDRNPDGLVFGRDGVIEYANPAFAEMLGYSSPDELSGKRFLSLVRSDLHESIGMRVREFDAGRRAEGICEDIFFRADGSEIALETFGTRFDHDGSRYGMVSFRSIEKRSEDHEALRESELRFHQLAQNISGVFWLMDLNASATIYVSPNYESIWGRSVESLYADPYGWMRAIHEIDRVRVEQSFAASAASGDWMEEYRINCPDGTERWIRDRAFPIRNAEGAIYRLAGIAEDVTEERKAQQRLRMHNFVLHHAPDEFYLADHNGRFLEVNDTACAHLGYSRDELLRMSVPDIKPKGPPEAWRRRWEQMNERGSMTFESVHRKKDGRTYPVEVVSRVIQFEGVECVCAFVRDISERKAHQQNLDFQRSVLELVARGGEIDALLEGMCRRIEEAVPGAISSVMLISDGALRLCAGPSMPQELRDVLAHVVPGEGVGSCGTAACRGTPVIVRDAWTDEAWKEVRHIAQQFGVRACWSYPIKGARGDVLGCFALSHLEPREPEQLHLDLLESGAHLAAIAIERNRRGASLRENQKRLAAIYESANDAIFVLDPESEQIAEVNPKAASMLEYEVSDLVDRPMSDIHPDEMEACRRFVKSVMDIGTGRTDTLHCSTRSGRKIPAEISASVVEINDRSLMLAMMRDVSDRIEQARLLAESEERYRLLLEGVRVIAWEADVTSWTFTLVGGQVEQMTGYTPEEWMTNDFWVDHIHPEDRERAVNFCKAFTNRGEDHEFEYRFLCKDGTLIWVRDFVTVELTDGRPGKLRGVIIDITEQKEAEHRMRFMMNELDHRVRNNLATVLSMAQQTVQASASPEEFQSSFSDRIHAMARLHEALAATRWSGVRLDEIARLVLSPYGSRHDERLRVSGSDIVLPAHAASPVCMALHELTTNAVKHGALASADGAVELKWSRRSSDHLDIEWIERGVNPVSSPERTGFGTSLIRGVIEHQLHGTVDMHFESEGLVCRMSIPILEDDDSD